MSSLARTCMLFTALSVSVPMTKAVMSSAYRYTSPDTINSDMSLMYMESNLGPKREPCGTPCVISFKSDVIPFTSVYCFLSSR